MSTKNIIHCLYCKHDTHHDVIKEFNKRFYPEDTPNMTIDFAHGTWEILQCRGCENITFREIWITSEDPEPIVKLYPPHNKNMLELKRFYSVPPILRKVYRELIDCYNNQIYTLCAAGLRALIEGICAAQNIKNGPVEIRNNDRKTKIIRKINLEGKIAGMAEKGILSRNHATILQEHRFLGNEALHELKSPNPDDLKAAIEIVEHTLENIYELQDKMEQIQFRRLGYPRKRKKRE